MKLYDVVDSSIFLSDGKLIGIGTIVDLVIEALNDDEFKPVDGFIASAIDNLQKAGAEITEAIEIIG